MEKQKYDVLAMVRRMLRIMVQQDKRQIGRVFVYTIIAGIYPFMSVFLPKIAIGVLETEGSNAIIPLIQAMLVYFLIAGVLAFGNTYLRSIIETCNMRIRLMYLSQMSHKLQTIDYQYIEDSHFWETNDKALNSANNNSDGVEGVYNRLCKLPAKLLTLVGMIILTGALNPSILVALVLHVAVTMWIARKNHVYQYEKKEDLAKATRKMSYYKKTAHDFSFGKDIRIFDLRERIMKNYTAEINALVQLQKKIANREYLFGFLGLGTLLLTNVVMYGILIMKAYQGMPISSFTMYVTAITSLLALMLTFGEDISFIANQGEYVDDFFRLMDEQLVKQGEVDVKPEGTLEIVFDHVTFRYPHTEADIIKDLNFTIHKGERVAIVGINGAGKSTLVKLMTGLFEPTSGHIYINGIDVREYRKKTLYDLYSAVFQDVNILAFTIRENVACASENVDDERVQKALEKVGLWKKVSGFEKGLDQMMLKVIDENGTDFSGGERQKLSIARGLYKNAAMVIMDEPTAALDALAEAEIYENFSSLVEGKTAVYISHRLASTRFCDKIALFDKDGLKEYGTHDELMELKGSYYDMFVIQGKYYQEEEAV